MRKKLERGMALLECSLLTAGLLSATALLLGTGMYMEQVSAFRRALALGRDQLVVAPIRHRFKQLEIDRSSVLVELETIAGNIEAALQRAGSSSKAEYRIEIAIAIVPIESGDGRRRGDIQLVGPIVKGAASGREHSLKYTVEMELERNTGVFQALPSAGWGLTQTARYLPFQVVACTRIVWDLPETFPQSMLFTLGLPNRLSSLSFNHVRNEVRS